ncbi:MAG: PilZ domain-containing protein [Deltaproteobacteria bacterium]|nr:PilZ domain-containing protein [Deltaproteobacteria bacterium]
MLKSFHVSSASRRVTRHRVDLPCDLITPHEDEPQLTWATDLSWRGAWVETEHPLEPGEEVVLCFRPTLWSRDREITVFAQVARASRGLRANDDSAGMGLRFLDLRAPEAAALQSWLVRRPPRLPRHRLGVESSAPSRGIGKCMHSIGTFASAVAWGWVYG